MRLRICNVYLIHPYLTTIWTYKGAHPKNHPEIFQHLDVQYQLLSDTLILTLMKIMKSNT